MACKLLSVVDFWRHISIPVRLQKPGLHMSAAAGAGKNCWDAKTGWGMVSCGLLGCSQNMGFCQPRIDGAKYYQASLSIKRDLKTSSQKITKNRIVSTQFECWSLAPGSMLYIVTREDEGVSSYHGTVKLRAQDWKQINVLTTEKELQKRQHST